MYTNSVICQKGIVSDAASFGFFDRFRLMATHSTPIAASVAANPHHGILARSLRCAAKVYFGGGDAPVVVGVTCSRLRQAWGAGGLGLGVGSLAALPAWVRKKFTLDAYPVGLQARDSLRQRSRRLLWTAPAMMSLTRSMRGGLLLLVGVLPPPF